MKCNNKNKSVTIGDMFDFAVFKGNVFVFSKQQKSNLKFHRMHELMKLYRSKEIEFTKVMQFAGSKLQLDKEPLLATVYSGVQVSSKCMRDYSNEPIVGEVSVKLLKNRKPTDMEISNVKLGKI